MHDTDMFARMPGMGSTAGRPQLEDLLHRFDEEREVAFKEEVYRVRDNGAVLRRVRASARKRPRDEVWTFGAADRHSGYLLIAGHRVHQVVASAFHGPRPSSEHVVDHIDTNRHNNRPENLRWVTRLENILLNPITRARIVFVFGSLEAFFANPGAQTIPNWEWMRTVTKEEAGNTRVRLERWFASGKMPKGEGLGEWVFTKPVATKSVTFDTEKWAHPLANAPPLANRSQPPPDGIDIPSLTPGAFQRRWRTPCEFPLCPAVLNETAIDAYLERLVVGAVFARNRYGESTVVEAGKSTDGALSGVCKTPSGVKDWSVARVFIEGGAICHESGGMFFDIKGATKAHLTALGVPFDEALYESIDDCS